MKRVGTGLLAGILSVVLIAGPVSAQEAGTMPNWRDHTGAIGIAAALIDAGDLGSVPVIQFIYWATEMLGISVSYGLQLSSLTTGEGEAEVTADSSLHLIQLAVRYAVIYFQRGYLGLCLGLNIGLASESVGSGGVTADQSGTDIQIALGLYTEVFLTQFISFSTFFGLLLDPIGENEPTAGGLAFVEDSTASGIDLRTVAGPLGYMAVTFYTK